MRPRNANKTASKAKIKEGSASRNAEFRSLISIRHVQLGFHISLVSRTVVGHSKSKFRNKRELAQWSAKCRRKASL